MKHFRFILATAAVGLMAACQHYVFPDDQETPIKGNGSARLHVNVGAFDYLPFDTRGAVSLSEVTKRLSFALFYINGEKVMNTQSQTSEDAQYGKLDIKLEPGKYVLVTVAHNGSGNCTISSPTEVKFTNNKVTDTFTSCDTIAVEEGEQSAYIRLVRRVAMMRLLLDETLPQEVKQIKFYYTGGSSTLDASLGYGSVNSRQTEILGVPTIAYEQEGSTYEVYTFPHEERDTLKMTITALDAEGNDLAECNLTKVPVRPRQITQYHGSLMGGNIPGLQLELVIDDGDWTQANYKF